MRKSQDRRWEFRGEITVFLSLMVVLLISLIGSLVESASISLAKSMTQANLSLAMESIFAEYEPELWEEYGIFAKQGSALYSIEQRLAYYGASNLDHKILRMELLSDGKGVELYRQGVAAMGGNVVQMRPSTDSHLEEEAKEALSEYEALLETENIEDPLHMESMGESVLLTNILPKEDHLSNKHIYIQSLPSHRQLKTGVGTQGEIQESLTGRWVFASYLTEHFLNYTNDQNIHPLSYETEYLLAGKATDAENLEWVAKRLLAIRLGINYVCLQGDSQRLAKAESIAIAVSALMIAPEAKEIIKQALLFFWAYEDSLQDLQKLYAGEKVSLSGNPQETGISYAGYLAALLAVERTEILCMRALDLIELNLGIEVDTLVTELEVESTGTARRNIPYICHTEYIYP